MIHAFGAALVAVAAPAPAQDFGERWEVIGTFELDVDGASRTLYAVRDDATGTSFAELSGFGGFRTIGITAGAEDPAGPVYPFVTVLIGPYRQDLPGRVDVEWRDGEDVFMANDESGTAGRIERITFDRESGALAMRFDAPELVEMTDAPEGEGVVPAEGGARLSVSGTFEGTVDID